MSAVLTRSLAQQLLPGDRRLWVEHRQRSDDAGKTWRTELKLIVPISHIAKLNLPVMINPCLTNRSQREQSNITPR